jgi:hypothetical protein
MLSILYLTQRERKISISDAISIDLIGGENKELKLKRAKK